jgi:hypothetical protein
MAKLQRSASISLGIALGLVVPAFFLVVGRAIGQEDALSASCLSQEGSSQTIEEARRDAADPQACEQWPALIPIRPDNPHLIWQDDRVLMVTWTRSCHPDFPDGLACQSEGDQFGVSGQEGNYALWVTAVPEIKAFVLRATYDPGFELQNLTQRLVQYLGLLPGVSRTFVELWVHPDDLIRPCLDPDPTDTQCELWSQATLDQAPPGFRASVVTDPTDRESYPFTGLGYTYDWGNPDTEVGASEFVIKAGATVTIAHRASTEEYLQDLIPLTSP